MTEYRTLCGLAFLAAITLVTSSCGGGGGGSTTSASSTSNAPPQCPTTSNLAPTVSSVSPTNVEIAGVGFTLTVNGANFISSSVVQWNGTSLPTTCVSSSALTAEVPPANIAVPADSMVTVVTPAPGGGTSNALKLSATPYMTPAASAISRATLDNYLTHSLVMQTWALFQPITGSTLQQHQDNLRMVANVGAKHIQWAAGFFWTTSSNYAVEPIMTAAAQIATDLHTQDPAIIVGAGVFETTSPLVNNIAVPAWVFEEFNQPVVTRNFDWTKMSYADQRVSDGNPNTPAIDITQLEARMWYYYWARRYIDIGYEDLHFGEIVTITQNDIPNYANYWDLVQRVRKYAATNARRGFVLINALSYPADSSGHTNTATGVHGIVSANGYLALDYLYDGLRPEENPSSPQDATLLEWEDTIFGRTAGGISPSGWSCKNSPYSASLDPGPSPKPGTPIGFPHVWGWSEWDWWVNQSEPYRGDWLWYAVSWLAATDPNGHLRMPGMGDGGGRAGIDWYHGNIPWYSQSDPNASTLNQYFYGFDDEPIIKTIVSGTADPYVINTGFARPVLSGAQTDVIAPTVPSWTFTGTAGVAGAGSAYVGAQVLNAGQQVGFVSGSGSISQPVIFPGSKSYHVQVNAADRVVNGTPDAQSLIVALDGTTVGTVTLTGSLATTAVNLGSPSAGVHRLAVTGTGASSATAIVASVTIVTP